MKNVVRTLEERRDQAARLMKSYGNGFYKSQAFWELNTRRDTYQEVLDLIKENGLTYSVENGTFKETRGGLMKRLFSKIIAFTAFFLAGCATQPPLTKWQEYRQLCEGAMVSSFKDVNVTIHCNGAQGTDVIPVNPTGRAIISTVKPMDSQ